MAKTYWIRLGYLGLWAALSGCTVDEPCQDNDPELIEKFDVPKHQTEGPDGLCYTVDPEVPNWGAGCDSGALCGGGLICAAPDLPICTAIGCNADPEKDEVCAKGFTCLATGGGNPNVCLPLPPAPPPPPPTPDPTDEPDDGSDEITGDAAAGDGGSVVSSDAGESTEATPVAPNIGTDCTSATDPICVGGTFCESQQMHYCTVPNCAAGLENEAACAAANGFCYTTAPAPATGICTVQ